MVPPLSWLTHMSCHACSHMYTCVNGARTAEFPDWSAARVSALALSSHTTIILCQYSAVPVGTIGIQCLLTMIDEAAFV